MRISIWIYENQLESLLDGDIVEYFEKEPGVLEKVLQVLVDPDTYQKLKDNTRSSTTIEYGYGF